MIEMQSTQVDEISRHGECDYPFECCGALLGKFSGDQKRVIETYSISNAREEEAKRNRFLITPQELIGAERYAKSRQLEIVGFYHSHPDHPAVPSEYDRFHAWPVYSYIVVSVAKGKAMGMRSWELLADRSAFVEEEILKGS